MPKYPRVRIKPIDTRLLPRGHEKTDSNSPSEFQSDSHYIVVTQRDDAAWHNIYQCKLQERRNREEKEGRSIGMKEQEIFCGF